MRNPLRHLFKGTLEGSPPSYTAYKPHRVDLNLHQYQILECEPLHDLKGHLSNLLHELPKIMEEPLSGEIQAIIDCDLNSKETKRGGDYWLTF